MGSLRLFARRRAAADEAAVAASARRHGEQSELAALREKARVLKEEVADAVAEQEAAEESARTADRARWFLLFDADRSGSIGLDDMRASLRKLPGCEAADPDWAPRLLARLDKDGDGELGPREFDAQELRGAVRLLELEERENAKLRQQARAAAAEWTATIMLRFFACLPYLLPVLTHLDAPATGDGVMQTTWAGDYPLLAKTVVALQDLDSFLFQTWWARTLVLNVLLLTSILASHLPRLVRFNCLQAAVLCILWYIPSMTSLALQSLGMSDVSFVDGVSLFYVLLACVLYAFAWSVNGRLPDGIPFVSNLVRAGIQY
eukprot:CAMPEP_0117473514 /NCGR_PEP_ID=MMETSP0784-20121206/8810_1 /TAXON_ID=39447 /ORGANISM="" /LENGTH=318 /DNA_ID=CAMNT_0005267715 /DNA_START=283 /DNA_END=1240 /DNA_ORIENTATION=+